MATNYTPHINSEGFTASELNARLQELDDAIEAIKSGAATLASPDVVSYVNSQHTHQTAAQGGQLTMQAIDTSDGDADDIFVADGVGGGSWTAPAVIQVPTGVIFPYVSTTPPSGWLLCSGAAVSRTTYAALFALIGTTFGAGDGSTTFNLPDLRGRAPVGMDNLGGSAASRIAAAATMGQAAGTETHTLALTEIPVHAHGSFEVLNPTGGAAGWGSGSGQNVSIPGQGSGAAHNNLQPYIALSYIIKA